MTPKVREEDRLVGITVQIPLKMKRKVQKLVASTWHPYPSMSAVVRDALDKLIAFEEALSDE